MSADDKTPDTTDDDAGAEAPAVLADAEASGDDDTQGHVFMGGETAKSPDGDEPTAVYRAGL